MLGEINKGLRKQLSPSCIVLDLVFFWRSPSATSSKNGERKGTSQNETCEKSTKFLVCSLSEHHWPPDKEFGLGLWVRRGRINVLISR